MHIWQLQTQRLNFISSEFIVSSDVSQWRWFLPVACAVWSSCARDMQALKDSGSAALEPGHSPWMALLSVWGSALAQFPWGVLSPGMPSRFHVCANSEQTWGAAWSPIVTVVRQAMSGFHYKESGIWLAMSAVAIPAWHEENGGRWRNRLPPAQLRKGQGVHSILALDGYSPWPGRLRRQSQGHKAASGFPRRWMEQYRPQAWEAWKDST